LRVALGTFARSGIESRFGEGRIVAGAQEAVLHYALRVLPGRHTPAFPRFQCEPQEALEIELELDAAMEATLKREAHKHRISVDRILAHAVLVYLADWDVKSALGTDSAGSV